MATQCMNCGQSVDSNYCPNCGQSARTHRFSLKHFFLHDLAHGIFHLNKGFFFTLKALFTHPGHSIRAYVEGKRVNHFNYFTYAILILTIGHLVGNITSIKLIDTTHYFTSDERVLTGFDKMARAYPKLFTLAKIPFLAGLTMLFFRKSGQNFTEHLILNTYKVCGEYIIAIVFTLIVILLQSGDSFDYWVRLVGVLSFAYSMWYYYQYFSPFGYAKWSLLLRSVIASILLFLISASVTAFIVGLKAGFEAGG